MKTYLHVIAVVIAREQKDTSMGCAPSIAMNGDGAGRVLSLRPARGLSLENNLAPYVY